MRVPPLAKLGEDFGLVLAGWVHGAVGFARAVDASDRDVGVTEASAALVAIVVFDEVVIRAVSTGGLFFLTLVGMVSKLPAFAPLDGGVLDKLWGQAAVLVASDD